MDAREFEESKVVKTAAALAIIAVASSLPARAGGAEPTPERQAELIRLVRQDCGACHGLRLTGGLGPALTREALGERPLESIEATIRNGRPGTPMPPWRALLQPGDAHWIAQQLAQGFPAQPPRVAR